MEDISEILAKSFKSYYKDNKFYKVWFRENGNAYYFLFKKNLHVTNIQYTELISLIKMYARNTENKKIGNKLQFLSVQQFNLGIREIVSTFIVAKEVKKNEKDVFIELANIYSNLLRYSVVVDCFYGSCAIFLPPGIDIIKDLASICASSGYIHSCGRNVFVRNIDKFNIDVFYDKLKNHLKGKRKKIVFSVYAHEDFTEYDRDYSDDLKHGLDEVKIYEEKFFMGKTSLMTLLNEIKKNRYFKKLIIPPRGNFKEEHEKIINEYGAKIDRNCSLWLIMDYSVKENTIERGNNRYYICYEQLYINENQFQLFDENKPAWKSSTTLPHTLASAMINIAIADNSKVYQENIGKIKLGDPFVGTGTLWFECLKYNFIDSYGRDLDPITSILIKDNLSFFSTSIYELRKLEKKYSGKIESFKMADLKKILEEANEQNLYEQFYNDDIKPLLKLIPNNGTSDILFNNDSVKKIRDSDFEKRFLLYLLIRVKLKHKYSFLKIGKEEEKTEAPLIKELSKMLLQINKLLTIKNQFENQQNDYGGPLNIISYQGKYSRALSLNEEFLRSKNKDIKRSIAFGKIGKIENLKKNFFDIIITDPPYGFNTDYSINELADFYQKMIRKIIQSLKDNGQVVMALPDKSLSGKTSPFFTHKEIVIQQFFQIAKDENKEIIDFSNILPSKELFRPPFFWEADKALRRSIIHLKFKNIPKKQYT